MSQTTVTLKLRPSIVKGKKSSIYIRLIKNRKIRSVTTSFRIYAEEWDVEKGAIRIDTSNLERGQFLMETSVALKKEIEELQLNIRQMEDSGNYALDEIMNFYFHKKRNRMLSNFVEKLKKELIEADRFRTAEAYQSVLNKIKHFNSGNDISLNAIDASFLKRFELYMKSQGNSQNTISFYMRNLRAIYNKAFRDKTIEKKHEDLFRDVYTGISKTRKRAVRKEVFEHFMKIDLMGEDKRSLNFSRDMFLISFYLRGISFVDLAYLKKEDVKNDIITYTRRKTSQRLEIEMIPEMWKIIRKYSPLCRNSAYLLPVLTSGDGRKDYIYALAKQNRNLKILSQMMALEQNLTTYVSRHSWASIARAKGYPVSVISQGLGHDSEKTTMIYLDSFDCSTLHRANRDIINYTKKVS